MNEDAAIGLAIEAIEAQIKTLQMDADLVDIWSGPQQCGNLIIVEDFRTPRRLAVSKKRTQYRRALSVLASMRSAQIVLELNEEML